MSASSGCSLIVVARRMTARDDGPGEAAAETISVTVQAHTSLTVAKQLGPTAFRVCDRGRNFDVTLGHVNCCVLVGATGNKERVCSPACQHLVFVLTTKFGISQADAAATIGFPDQELQQLLSFHSAPGMPRKLPPLPDIKPARRRKSTADRTPAHISGTQLVGRRSVATDKRSMRSTTRSAEMVWPQRLHSKSARPDLTTRRTKAINAVAEGSRAGCSASTVSARSSTAITAAAQDTPGASPPCACRQLESSSSALVVSVGDNAARSVGDNAAADGVRMSSDEEPHKLLLGTSLPQRIATARFLPAAGARQRGQGAGGVVVAGAGAGSASSKAQLKYHLVQAYGAQLPPISLQPQPETEHSARLLQLLPPPPLARHMALSEAFIACNRERRKAELLGVARKVDHDWDVAYHALPHLKREALRYLHPQSLFDSLAPQPPRVRPEVALLKASFLLARAASGSPLPPRQVLERECPEAYITVEELRERHARFTALSSRLARSTAPDEVQGRSVDVMRGERMTYSSQLEAVPIVVISYKWREKAHPDRHGHTLREVARVLHDEINGEGATEHCQMGYRAWGFDEVGVFWECVRYHQPPVSPQAPVPEVHTERSATHASRMICDAWCHAHVHTHGWRAPSHAAF